MNYLKSKNIKALIHDQNKQISHDGLVAIDKKVEEYLLKLCTQFNGHKKRITPELIYLVKI